MSSVPSSTRSRRPGWTVSIPSSSRLYLRTFASYSAPTADMPLSDAFLSRKAYPHPKSIILIRSSSRPELCCRTSSIESYSPDSYSARCSFKYWSRCAYAPL